MLELEDGVGEAGEVEPNQLENMADVPKRVFERRLLCQGFSLFLESRRLGLSEVEEGSRSRKGGQVRAEVRV